MLQCILSTFFFLSLSGCFAVNSITSTHHNTSLGQCQRQCMVSTHFGYKVCIHESPSPQIVWWVRVAHLFSFLWCVFVVHNVATFSGLSLRLSLPFIYYLQSFMCHMCPMLPVFSGLSLRLSLPFIYSLESCMCLMYPILPVSLDISFLIAPSVISNFYLELNNIHCINKQLCQYI